MPKETKVQVNTSVDAVGAHEHPLCGGGPTGTVAGASFDLAKLDAGAAMEILEKAFDYRGDVTLTLRDGRSVVGYLFDRRKGKGLGDSVVRVMLADEAGTKVSVGYGEIAAVAMSERDPAAGKSFETWVKKYVEKKLRGESASIESEVLD